MANKKSKNTIGSYTRGKLERIITEVSGDSTSSSILTASSGLCVTGSAKFKDEAEFASDVHIAGTLYGSSPLKIAGSVEIYDTSSGTPQLHTKFGTGVKQSFKHHLGVHVSSDNDITHGITLPNSTTANSGSIKAYSYETYSSSRFKTNIRTIDNAIGKIKDMRGVYFEWKDSNRKDIGFIAEEVGDVIPEAVAYEDNGVDASSMSYQKLVSLLLQSVKEQQDIIEDQNDRISQLEQKIDESLKKEPGGSS